LPGFAADHFDDDINFRIIYDLTGILDENAGGKGDASIGFHVRIGHIFKMQRYTDALLN
jgi:hypothetical protein